MRRQRIGIRWWQGCEARKPVSGAGVDVGGFGVQAIAAVKFLWYGVGLMNDTLDVILVNRCNQSDKFQTVLPAKMCVRVLAILILAAAAVLVVGAGVLAVLLLACAGMAAGATWVVDDDGGAGYVGTQAEAAA